MTTPTEPTRIGVVSPTVLVGESIAALLGRHLSARPVVISSFDLRGLSAARSVDLLVYDGSTSLAIRSLEVWWRQTHPAPVIVFGLFEADDDLAQCARWLVSGMIATDDSFSELHSAITRVLDGGTHCSSRLAPALSQLLARHRKAVTLSPRERQIALLVARGHENREILIELGVRRATLKTHMQNIFRKLRVNRRAQLLDLRSYFESRGYDNAGFASDSSDRPTAAEPNKSAGWAQTHQFEELSI